MKLGRLPKVVSALSIRLNCRCMCLLRKRSAISRNLDLHSKSAYARPRQMLVSASNAIANSTNVHW